MPNLELSLRLNKKISNNQLNNNKQIHFKVDNVDVTITPDSNIFTDSGHGSYSDSSSYSCSSTSSSSSSNYSSDSSSSDYSNSDSEFSNDTYCTSNNTDFTSHTTNCDNTDFTSNTTNCTYNSDFTSLSSEDSLSPVLKTSSSCDSCQNCDDEVAPEQPVIVNSDSSFSINKYYGSNRKLNMFNRHQTIFQKNSNESQNQINTQPFHKFGCFTRSIGVGNCCNRK
jgi:hypothetical protein